MEYGETFENSAPSFTPQQKPLQLSEDTKRQLLKDIALHPKNYIDQSTHKNDCKHSWRRFPMWAHYRDGVSRSYCLNCPTIGHFNPFGDVKHHRITRDAYTLVSTNTNWN